MEQKEMKYPSVHSPKIWHGPSSFLAGKAAMPYKDAHCSALAAWILSSIRSKKGSRPRFPFSRWKTWDLKASNGLTILFRISLHNYTTRRTEQLKCTILTNGFESILKEEPQFYFHAHSILISKYSKASRYADFGSRKKPCSSKPCFVRFIPMY